MNGRFYVCHSGFPVNELGARESKRRETVLVAEDCSHTDGRVTIEFSYPGRYHGLATFVLRDMSATIANGYYWYGQRGTPQPKVGELMPDGWVKLKDVRNISVTRVWDESVIYFAPQHGYVGGKDPGDDYYWTIQVVQ